MIKHIRMKPKNGLNTSVDSQTCSDEMPSKQETFSYVEKKYFHIHSKQSQVKSVLWKKNISVLFTFSYFS